MRTSALLLNFLVLLGVTHLINALYPNSPSGLLQVLAVAGLAWTLYVRVPQHCRRLAQAPTRAARARRAAKPRPTRGGAHPKRATPAAAR